MDSVSILDTAFVDRRGDQSADMDAGGGQPKLSAYVRLHFGRILMKMNKFYAYLDAPDNIHSHLDNFDVNRILSSKPEQIHYIRHISTRPDSKPTLK